MTQDYSGPAFPVQEAFDERRGETTQYGSTGMTLRDYFAAKAISGLISTGAWDDETAAKTAYELADAMLKARQQ